MTIITRDELKKLAKLSSLHLDEQEIESLLHHISDVLAYASRVQEVASFAENDIESHELVNVVRPDTVVPPIPEQILAQVPQVTENFIVVPHILEGN